MASYTVEFMMAQAEKHYKAGAKHNPVEAIANALLGLLAVELGRYAAGDIGRDE